jgi:EAL domain-containing protein (putative c-di-GMP-specific phosphodiesterase class I)/DNA-binding response OmpR family regulator
MESRKHPLSILLIEDSPMDARLLLESLREYSQAGEIMVQSVRRLTDGLTEMRRFNFSCVLIDLGLPDGRGVGNVQALREVDKKVAVVVLTGLNDETAALDALKMGAQEYVVKGQQDGEQLLKTIRHAIQRNQQMSALEASQSRRFFEATHDPITQLPNADLFHDRVQQWLMASPHTLAQVVSVQLSGAAQVLSQQGQVVFDEVMSRIGQILLEVAPPHSGLGRLSEAEFALFSPLADTTLPRKLWEKIHALKQIATKSFDLQPLVGSATTRPNADHPDSSSALLQEARSRALADYSQPVAPSLTSSLQSVAALTQALVGSGFTESLFKDRLGVYYQPWQDPLQKTWMGVEVLPYWRDVEGGTDSFLATDIAPVQDVLLALLPKVLKQWKAHQAAFAPTAVLAFNVNQRVFPSVEAIAPWLAALQSQGVSPERIQLEWNDPPSSQEPVLVVLNALREAGFRVVADRIGAQPLDLITLTQTRWDGFKIDAVWTEGLSQETLMGAKRRTISAFLGLAGSLAAPVVFMGVDSLPLHMTLSILGARLLQGSHIAPPCEDFQLELLKPAGKP